MTKKIVHIILVVFFTLSIFSCKDAHEFRVDSEFAVYLKRFVDSAKVRGLDINPERDGIIMEFAELDNNTAGLTHYEQPPRIEFDKKYWLALASTAGVEDMKENLVFHELGHALLKRKHLNTTLENGDWKSMMCGGDKVNNRPWNINYKGIRRSYYIDELFDEKTPAPAFASRQLAVDTSGFKSRIYLNFDSEASSGWELVDDERHRTTLIDGTLRFESKTTDLFFLFAKTNVDVLSDFSYELTLQYLSSDPAGHFGLLFGAVAPNSTGATDPVEYFTICKNYWMRMGNRAWYSFFTEIPESNIYPNGRNKLKVCKIGNFIHYFINNIYVYSSEIEIMTNGYQYGFVVPPKGVVLVDDFVISKRYDSGLKLRGDSKAPVLFETLTVPPRSNEIFK